MESKFLNLSVLFHQFYFFMRKEDLLEMQKKQLRGESYENALSGYLDIVEHYVFIGNTLKAKKLIRWVQKVSFKRGLNKTISSYEALKII